MKVISVAIDGPSGAGKSSLARRAAKTLGFVYVDTGAIYRTVAFYCSENGISPDDSAAVAAALPQMQIQIDYSEDGTQRMLLGQRDVSEQIRTPEISMLTSAVAAVPEVRAYLLDMQRKLAQVRSVIMDGRDIGTVVLPNATVKIYLTAAPEARAQRRCKELRDKGMDVTFEEILKGVQERDYNDTHRDISPLKRADDAHLVDTTCLDFEESLDVLVKVIRQYTGADL